MFGRKGHTSQFSTILQSTNTFWSQNIWVKHFLVKNIWVEKISIKKWQNEFWSKKTFKKIFWSESNSFQKKRLSKMIFGKKNQ